MPRNSVRIACERGWTLIELLVVVVVVGVLAAIALPVFLSQQGKGKDAAAKSDARNVATAVESCSLGERDYRDCDEQSELASESGGYGWGNGPGQVRVLSATANSFTVEAVSKQRTGSTSNTFTLTRESNGSVSRTCSGTGGCDDGSW
ncbi:MAG TPA: prepilin-type N-terminal cleavage/methylation domain-containing protein [Thermoleophilaceae bacterium]|nr:prepilin-type N-terminal cleavage/methylation domain-containing protein [Thermoleophilaceae bacterium]